MTPGTSYSPPPAFGRFKLLHQIGAGVLGPVFRTHDPDHDRLVAVKAFTLDLTPEQASALAAEFVRVATLGIDAPCLAAPIAAGLEEFVPYVAVPYVSGESLDAAVRQYGPAPAGDAIRLIAHVADALDAAALAGVHHGSLHPRDIIVTPGETHVTGVGVAQALERVGLHGPVRRPYVAPEREGGDEWGAPADIYALAAIAYEVLTGRRALPGTDQPLPGLHDLRVHDAAALREVIEAALDPDPARRPARARDFAAGFAAALSESAAAGAIADRTPDRRARKPRTRPPKLPGLDEPLTAQEGAAKARARAAVPVGPAPPIPSGPAPPPVEAAIPAAPPAPIEVAPAEPDKLAVESPGPASDTLRYVPVTDPADAGEVARERPPSPPKGDGAVLEAAGAPAEPTRGPAPPEPSARLAAGLTPDLRLADELMSRADAAGETVDADLAAALDRLSPDYGANPTPVALGLDLPGPGALAKEGALDLAAAGVVYDLAAETRLGPETPGPAAGPAFAAEPAVPALDRAGAGTSPRKGTEPDSVAPAETAPMAAPAFGEGSVPRPVEEPPAAAPAQAAAQTPEPQAEPLRPYVRGSGADRRRPSPRFGRFDAPAPTPTPGGTQGAGVPRAFEEGRPTPLPRPVPDFELLTRPEPSRLPLVPVIIGVVGGLIVGLAGGYWLGSRSVPPAAVPAAQMVPAAPAVQQPPAPAAAAPSAQPGPSPVASASPSTAAPPPPAAPEPAPPAAAPAVRGTIQVTASQQANVFLDGQRQGMTPRSLRNVPLGRHTIRVTRPGYAPQEQAVVLTADEPTASMSFALRPAGTAAQAGGSPAPAVRSVLIVVVESNPPGARIRIDGRDLAPTPLTIRQLRPGTHTLELRLPGYKTWTQRITVAAGDNRRITATLERDNPR